MSCCPATLALLACDLVLLRRMMSDWKVDLVNDNISELNVEFKGPPDSESEYQAIGVVAAAPQHKNDTRLLMYRSILRRSLEGACGAS